jgi:molecular chaperone DnaK (HSP70)
MTKVIVSIDFGTSGTTYAFAFVDAKDDIICAKWTEIPNSKNLTEIILDENDEIITFGKECQEYLSQQSSSEKKFYHFTDIKMRLYKNEIKIKANNDNQKEVDIDLVISKILIKIKEIALKEIMSLRSGIEETNIKWRVTVPAIWSNKSKYIMKNASVKAGIFNDPLTFFALEPEAAACDYTEGKVSDQEAIKPGNNYIVCDIGGGTIDISTHRRMIDNNNNTIYIEEIYHPIGGAHGSTNINKLFIERVIERIFGKETIDKLSTVIKNPSLDKDLYIDYCIFLEEIENFKINIKKEFINDKKRIN